MVRITTPEPPVELDEQESALGASDLAHLHRALIPPIAAAFVHEFGAFFVIFNSARLLRFEGKGA